jgi:hypothetical protein
MLLRSVARWLGQGSPMHAYRAAPLSTERGREAHLDSVKLTMPTKDMREGVKSRFVSLRPRGTHKAAESRDDF